MNNNYIIKQIKDANNNFNYFLVRLITLIIKAIFTISIVLIINSFILSTTINVISIIFCIIYGIYLYNKISYYIDIMLDIRNTISKEKITYELDLNILSDNLFAKRLNYGK